MSVQLNVSPKIRRFRVSEERLLDIVAFLAARHGLSSAEVALTLVGDAKIRGLNREYRGKDRATDVLSFPLIEWPRPVSLGKASRATEAGAPPMCLGDIVISLPAAKRNAREIGQSLDREVCFLVVHGFLHLCGHDHVRNVEERAMLAAQRKLMALMEEGAKAPLWRGCVKELR
jgi:rRNA maturation RNase YbeY